MHLSWHQIQDMPADVYDLWLAFAQGEGQGQQEDAKTAAMGQSVPRRS